MIGLILARVAVQNSNGTFSPAIVEAIRTNGCWAVAIFTFTRGRGDLCEDRISDIRLEVCFQSAGSDLPSCRLRPVHHCWYCRLFRCR